MSVAAAQSRNEANNDLNITLAQSAVLARQVEQALRRTRRLVFTGKLIKVALERALEGADRGHVAVDVVGADEADQDAHLLVGPVGRVDAFFVDVAWAIARVRVVVLAGGLDENEDDVCILAGEEDERHAACDGCGRGDDHGWRRC